MSKRRPSVNELQLFTTDKEWETKSNGRLRVLYAIPYPQVVGKFLDYDSTEVRGALRLSRGLRLYAVDQLMRSAEGGGEFHRIREEIVTVVSGSVTWTFEDCAGQKKVLTVTAGQSVWIPPFILHTYRVEEDHTTLVILANTLFTPDDPSTHDTYPRTAFSSLQSPRE